MESYLARRNNNASKNINVYINPDQTISNNIIYEKHILGAVTQILFTNFLQKTTFDK
jgi:hypothetical protein